MCRDGKDGVSNIFEDFCEHTDPFEEKKNDVGVDSKFVLSIRT